MKRHPGTVELPQGAGVPAIRSILLALALLSLPGCGLFLITGAGVASGVLDASASGLSGRSTCDEEGVVCESASDARARERDRARRNDPIMASGRAMTREALAAARAGNCARVQGIEQELLALPEIEMLEGGLHDTVFLRHPEIVRCLVEVRRARIAATTPERAPE